MPLPPEQETPARTPKTVSGAFERGTAALAQHKGRMDSVGIDAEEQRGAGAMAPAPLAVSQKRLLLGYCTYVAREA